MKEVVGMGFNGVSLLIYVTELTPQLTRVLPTKLDDVPVSIVLTGTKITPM